MHCGDAIVFVQRMKTYTQQWAPNNAYGMLNQATINIRYGYTDHKSDNLQYNMLVRWDRFFANIVSIYLSIFLLSYKNKNKEF